MKTEKEIKTEITKLKKQLKKIEAENKALSDEEKSPYTDAINRHLVGVMKTEIETLQWVLK